MTVPPSARPVSAGPSCPQPQSPACAPRTDLGVTPSGPDRAGHSQQLRIGKTIVFRSLRTRPLPSRPIDGRASGLNPYKALLLQRWNQGCMVRGRCVRPPPTAGLPGELAAVALYAQRLRQAQGLAPANHRPDAPAARSRGTPAPATSPRGGPPGSCWAAGTRAPEEEKLLVQLDRATGGAGGGRHAGPGSRI